MTQHALTLILLSALLHPIRDLLLKGHRRPESAYLAVTGIWVVIAAAHAFLSGSGLAMPGTSWGLAVASAACLTAYYFVTMAALKSGDLSIYYPIIRSSPLLIVVLAWFIDGTRYSTAVLIGIVMIVVAGFALQRQPGRIIASPRTALLAIVAMAGSAGYIIAEQTAMANHGAAALPVGAASVTPEAFLFWVYLMVAPAFAALALLFRPTRIEAREHLFSGWVQTPGRLVAAGLISYASYLCILLAFQAGAGAAETAAVRQASIPVSVILAALILGETRLLHRLGWALLIAAGIVLIALYGL